MVSHFFTRLKKWLTNLSSPSSDTLAKIGEDMRKIAITSIGVGLVGLTVAGDIITNGEAILLLCLGFGIYYSNQIG